MAVRSTVTNNTYRNLKASTSKIGTSTQSQDSDYKAMAAKAFGSSSKLLARASLAEADLARSNPDFHSSAWSTRPGGGSNTLGTVGAIQRGYIRRANEGDKADPTNGYRLQFMYNPETIQRSYIAYLDQQALDPFNTINGSENSTAAPGILDFQFELFFDRQIEESSSKGNDGCLVDLKYFDLVVRGVPPTARNSAIPDNGIMMVNPRDVVVVFSNELMVRGRPYNAAIGYDRFSHDMTPTRVRVSIALKAMYIGPQPPVLELPSESQEKYKTTIPYENTVKAKLSYYEPKSDEDAIKRLRDARYTTDTPSTGTTPTSGGGGGGGGTGGTGGNGVYDLAKILLTIRTRESGGNYQAINSAGGPTGASGAYQFISSTWRAYGGSTSRAYQATPAEQDRVATNFVNSIMGGSTDVRKIPGNWYYPAWWNKPELWDTIPRPDAGNTLTYRQYIDKWMSTYNGL